MAPYAVGQFDHRAGSFAQYSRPEDDAGMLAKQQLHMLRTAGSSDWEAFTFYESSPAQHNAGESPVEAATLSRGDFLPDIHARQGSAEEGSPVFESPAKAGDAPGWRGHEKVKSTGLAQNLGQLEASSRDFHSNCWANLRILGQPCEFQVGGTPTRRALDFEPSWAQLDFEPGRSPGVSLGLYPIVTLHRLQCSSTALYQISYNMQ
jgi:hypothetical protein